VVEKHLSHVIFALDLSESSKLGVQFVIPGDISFNDSFSSVTAFFHTSNTNFAHSIPTDITGGKIAETLPQRVRKSTTRNKGK